ncbi:hypothetical protein [Cerasicoccus arenae]|uniref:Uncharacterized protein n=1 Tax=Cerasicoccus arenae TaxID=424488 RepID=A0A8J3GCW9_9BACT|nr:hypothetical protein [Cerasicoccus arenae]MBK1858227.1 hypothetical protein [Cerasicoccus arenae]GHC02021.1 hypothetical protein GCM10007047_18140 [Cerasicoccus arenae]
MSQGAVDSNIWHRAVRLDADIASLERVVEVDALPVECTPPSPLAVFLGEFMDEVLPECGLTGQASIVDLSRLLATVAIYSPEALPHWNLEGEPISGELHDSIARAVLGIVLPAKGLRSERNLRAAFARLLALVLAVCPELLPGATPKLCAHWLGVSWDTFRKQTRQVSDELYQKNGSFCL